MDDTQKTPPPHPDEVTALASDLTQQPAPPGETRSTEAEPAGTPASADPGLARATRDSNLDAVAQADPATRPDRYSAEALQEIVQGGTIPVPVHQINRALIEIWKSTTVGGEHEGKVSVSLMRAMNLVAYVENADRAQQVTEVISRITGRHPCRTTLIVDDSGPAGPNAPATAATPAHDADLDVYMSAHCQLARSGSKRVCCEQVTITATSQPALYRASTIALNLLITDLPVFLWWASGGLVNNVVLANLEDSVDRLIVDSATFPDPLAGLLALTRTADVTTQPEARGRYAASDLNWDRLSGWREATAYFFDQPAYTPSLWHIGSAEIQYAAPDGDAPPNPIQGLLYVGWLATRLGWEFRTSASLGGRGGPGDFVLTLQQGMRSIPVIMRAVAPDTANRPGLVSVRLTTNEANPITFALRMAANDLFVNGRVEREGQEPQLHNLRYTPLDEAGLLDSELEVFGHDPIYEQALAQAGTMAWASLSLRRRTDLSAQFGHEQRRSSFDPRF